MSYNFCMRESKYTNVFQIKNSTTNAHWEAVNVLILKINIRGAVKNDNYSLTYFMDFTTFRMQNQKGIISMYNCTILSIAKINN